MANADYVVYGGGTVFVLTPLNDFAKSNLEENLLPDAQWFGNGVAVEHRYIADLVEQLRSDGWSVR